MWDAFRERIESGGGCLKLNSRITRILHDGTRVTGVEVEHDGSTYLQPADHVISTMPMRHLIQRFDPPAPRNVVEAASRLKYRDFLTVALIIDQAAVFPDNWIYVHDERVRVGRIQNYKNWSADMVPDPRFTCLGLEYFCFAGDGLWSKTDAELVELATHELDVIGLTTPDLVRDGTVVRVPKAYPVYDEGYEAALQESRQFLERFSNLQLVGRNGMHKYNNQDHSMLTAMLAVRNLFGERHCLWDVNADDDYHEEHKIESERATRPSNGRLTGQTQPAVPRLL
jgi:protoporphyrinogen oxidase